MSLTSGTVSVDGSGNVTGSGMALGIYNGLVTSLQPSLPASASAATIVAWKQGQALFATALAAGIVPYLTANVVIGAGTFKDSINNNATTGAGTFS